MQWEAIGAIGEVGGAIAVILTLAYLARQVRDSAQATRITAYHQAQEQLWFIGAAVSTDPKLAEIFAQASAEGADSLSAPDGIRFGMAMSSLFFGIESMLMLHEKGHIDPELWQNLFENNIGFMMAPGSLEYLASRRGPISRRLEALINEHREREGDA